MSAVDKTGRSGQSDISSKNVAAKKANSQPFLEMNTFENEDSGSVDRLVRFDESERKSEPKDLQAAEKNKAEVALQVAAEKSAPLQKKSDEVGVPAEMPSEASNKSEQGFNLKKIIEKREKFKNEFFIENGIDPQKATIFQKFRATGYANQQMQEAQKANPQESPWWTKLLVGVIGGVIGMVALVI